MDNRKQSNLSLSSSRSRRSNVNLADLRPSPLSTRFTEPSKDESPSSHDEPIDNLSFRRTHSSYIHGKSAPATPGILSRSSSRKQLGAGLSRSSSIYDEEDGMAGLGLGGFDYAGVVRGEDGSARVAVGSGQIPKAKSEAALLVQRSKLASKGTQAVRSRQQLPRSRTGGNNTPRLKTRSKGGEDDWFTRTGAATNALLQENKGQSWSSTSLQHVHDTSDEEDEGYEELAAQSGRRQVGDEEFVSASTRASRWGSRYGSRTASRRTSRRGSVSLTTGSRTPIAPQDGTTEYFDGDHAGATTTNMDPDFVDGGDEASESADEAALNRLAQTRSFGVGGIIDRIMNFSLFQVEEREEVTEDDEEGERGSETEEQATERREAEKKRKREEKEKLVNRSGGGSEGGSEGEGGGAWADAAWLLGVASKAIL